MSKQNAVMNATIRTESGKGAARRARATGGVPGIVYGPKKEGVGVVVDPREIVKALSGPMRRNTIITLNLKDAAGKDAGSRTVVVKDLQMHAIKRVPTHLDFLEVDANRAIAFKVPLELTGKSKAVADGGKTALVVRTLNVMAKPGDVPATIGFDVSNIGFGTVRAKQLSLPAGLELLDPADMPVVSVRVPREAKEDAAAAEAAPAADAKAAPAKAGAKPDAKAAAPAADAKKK